jgi:CubicO group peptidase (beta-lactamase class C family)
MSIAAHTFAKARAVVRAGVAARAFPAAVVEVGRREGVTWREAFGRLRYATEADAEAPACTEETIFDLASLTKVIASTSLVMRHVAAGRVSLEARVADLLPAWRVHSSADVRVRHLLDHSSGLPAHARLWETARGRGEFERAICGLALELERAPGTQSVYSDPGFMLLGFLLEDLAAETLDVQGRALAEACGGTLGYNPAAGLRARIAPTEYDAGRGRVLQGDVHDENAAALGGVAGHAGLFGTAGAVGAFARLVLDTFIRPTLLGTPALMQVFASRTGVPESSRALGWDTMKPTSSCGTRMSGRAIGHTGFTGTSLWIDCERNGYVVFLTNRVHPTRANEALIAIRPVLHDAVMEELD